MNSLWYENNVGKGSRQLGSVTSEQGLALRTGRDGLESEADLEGSRAGCLCVWAVFAGFAVSVRALSCGDSELELAGWWAASAMFVRLSGLADFVSHKTVDSELARTRGIRLSN